MKVHVEGKPRWKGRTFSCDCGALFTLESQADVVPPDVIHEIFGSRSREIRARCPSCGEISVWECLTPEEMAERDRPMTSKEKFWLAVTFVVIIAGVIGILHKAGIL